MDALAKIYPVASDLLSRSDTTLATSGIPSDHSVVPLLRSAGRLPGDYAASFATWDPAALNDQAALLRHQSATHRQISETLRTPITASPQSGWDGNAATAYGARASSAAARSDALADSADTLATHLTHLADWLTRARLRFAHTLASALTSREALTLTSPVPAPASQPGWSPAAPATHPLTSLDAAEIGPPGRAELPRGSQLSPLHAAAAAARDSSVLSPNLSSTSAAAAARVSAAVLRDAVTFRADCDYFAAAWPTPTIPAAANSATNFGPQAFRVDGL